MERFFNHLFGGIIGLVVGAGTGVFIIPYLIVDLIYCLITHRYTSLETTAIWLFISPFSAIQATLHGAWCGLTEGMFPVLRYPLQVHLATQVSMMQVHFRNLLWAHNRQDYLGDDIGLGHFPDIDIIDFMHAETWRPGAWYWRVDIPTMEQRHHDYCDYRLHDRGPYKGLVILNYYRKQLHKLMHLGKLEYVDGYYIGQFHDVSIFNFINKLIHRKDNNQYGNIQPGLDRMIHRIRVRNIEPGPALFGIGQQRPTLSAHEFIAKKINTSIMENIKKLNSRPGLRLLEKKEMKEYKEKIIAELKEPEKKHALDDLEKYQDCTTCPISLDKITSPLTIVTPDEKMRPWPRTYDLNTIMNIITSCDRVAFEPITNQSLENASFFKGFIPEHAEFIASFVDHVKKSLKETKPAPTTPLPRHDIAKHRAGFYAADSHTVDKSGPQPHRTPSSLQLSPLIGGRGRSA